VDTIMRAAQEALSKALGGQAVVIENLPGAGGITGASAIVKAAPDGRPSAWCRTTTSSTRASYKKMPFDAVEDITPIRRDGHHAAGAGGQPGQGAGQDGEGGWRLFSRPSPRAANYASSGHGTILHLAAQVFVDEVGAPVRHVPYKGVAPMVVDLIGGQVELGVLALPSAQAHLKSGALRAIGVMSPARVAVAPDLPPLPNRGCRGSRSRPGSRWSGPAKLPPAQVKRSTMPSWPPSTRPR
jgi:tripartite-type tricarboxylate transporter receptor subunit TctC